jgi:hypothetical protein
MAKDDLADLLKFMKPFSDEVKETALWLRDFVWDLYPNCNELIYDNYNALAFGWSPTEKLGDTFCTIAVLEKYVHFGFYWGTQISDPEKLLLGKGNQYRYIIVKSVADFPKTYIKKLLKEAYANSRAKMKDKRQVLKGATITKSISPVKKRPKKVSKKTVKGRP